MFRLRVVSDKKQGTLNDRTGKGSRGDMSTSLWGEDKLQHTKVRAVGLWRTQSIGVKSTM